MKRGKVLKQTPKVPKKSPPIKKQKLVKPIKKKEKTIKLPKKSHSIVKNSKPVKIPAKKKNNVIRIPSGIKGFDPLVEGGFKKSSSNLLIGSSGSGKSIFSTNFLMEGIRRKEKVLYITFEENKEEFFSNMAEFGWDLEEQEKKDNFFFLEYTPEKVRTMLEEGGGEIENIVLRKKIQRIVVDSITSFELLFSDDSKRREAALALFNLLKKWDVTSLVTYESDSSKELIPTPGTLEFESDSIIVLYFIRKKKERKRYLEVLKMRGTDHSKKIHSFNITKRGIEVSGRTVQKFQKE